MGSVKISIVYDNRLHDESFKSGWGFSCLVERSGKRILFDAGDNPQKLSFNLAKLGVKPQNLTAIVISHNHWDHTGGLQAVIGKNKNLKVYFGKSYPATFKQKLKFQGIGFSLVKDIHLVAEGIFAGPEMGSLLLREIPLTIETEKGLVVITGCAHPGILEMANAIREKLNKNIYLVLGGFHLGVSLRLNAIIQGIKGIGVKKVAPGHCSGKKAIKLFKEEFQEDFINVGAGLKIEI